MSARRTQKDPLDRYYTPQWAVLQWAEIVWSDLIDDDPKWDCAHDSVLEPSCGTGRFVAALSQYGIPVHAIDIDARAVERLADVAVSDLQHVKAEHRSFFSLDPAARDYCVIVGNPPFANALEFCEHALSFTPRVSFLVRLGFLSSQKRSTFFREHPPAFVHILSKRPAFDTPAGPATSTDSADYCFVSWTGSDRAQVHGTTVFWLPSP